eukprot:59393_1
MSQEDEKIDLDEIAKEMYDTMPVLMVPGRAKTADDKGNYKNQFQIHWNAIFKWSQAFAVEVIKDTAQEMTEIMSDKDGKAAVVKVLNGWIDRTYPFPQDESKIKRDDVLVKLTRLFNSNSPIVVFYSGHGTKDNGSWCFVNKGYITWNDIKTLIKKRKGNVIFFLDCCYSGNWTVNLGSLAGGNIKDVHMFAGSWPTETGSYEDNLSTKATNKWSDLFSQFVEGNNSDDDYSYLKNKFYGSAGIIDSKGNYKTYKFMNPW